MSSAPRVINADISRIIKYAPAELIGREAETKLLKSAWAKVTKATKNHPHVLTFVALGGEGKTSLVADWAVDMQLKHWPGCDAAFAWSFYSQGTREQVAASSDLFLKEALTFFGDDADKQFAASPAGAFDKGQRLARIVGQRRSLLILDGLEPLQYAPTSPTPGELKDAGIAALLKGLAATSHGLCVVTTRYSLPDLKAFRQTTAPEVKLLRLSRDAGVHLLKTLGVRGTAQEFATLVEDVKGHALTLTLLGSYLREGHGGDIRKRDLVKLEEADAEIVLITDHPNHLFHVMDAYVEWFETGGKNEEENKKGFRALTLLRLLGLFDRPATAESLNALWTGDAIANLTEPLVGLKDTQRNISLTRLETAKLMTVNRDASGALVSLDAHPHLREYFARQLRTQQPDAWRAAHRRLYEYLRDTTPDKAEPTLEDLQPLYQAVAHGCQAGLHQETCDEVYFARILRREENYSTFRLGALSSDLGAIACFFEKPWSGVSPALTDTDQVWLLNESAFSLRALGRLTESLEPMRAGVEGAVRLEDWTNVPRYSNNLSELDLMLGEVAGAVRDAEQSVTYADRSGDFHLRQETRCTHADALHQAGDRPKAETRFREAEEIHADGQPTTPLLYSVRGFKYCDLLLAGPERAAWQEIQKSEARTQQLELVQQCHAVSQRAAQTLKWVTGKLGLLDEAHDHLTLGRAALYETVLAMGGLPFKTQNSELKTSIDAAVDGLRRAGQQDYLLRGLLTRPWVRFLNGARTGAESAQEDLDEAWEIAERGPMRLFMADIHLYRARLFHSVKPYPWGTDAEGIARGPKDDLAAARRLIEQCGYWRRKEELEDAEAAAKSW